REARYEKPDVDQVRRIDGQAPLSPAEFGWRHDRRAGEGDPRPRRTRRAALAGLDDPRAEPQLRSAIKALRHGRPERGAVTGEVEIARQRVARLDLDPLGRELARLRGAAAREIEDAVALLHPEGRDGHQRAGARMPLEAGLPLFAGLGPEGIADTAVGIFVAPRDRQEAFGVTYKGRNPGADVADNPGSEGRRIILVPR